MSIVQDAVVFLADGRFVLESLLVGSDDVVLGCHCF